MDIAGFIYDPKTKRYYRETTGPWAHVKKEHVNDVSTMISPKPKGILDLLRQRETGVRKNYNIESPFQKMKMDLNFDIEENVKVVDDQPITSILMIKGGQCHHNFFGLWKRKDGYEDVVGEVYPESCNYDPQFRFRKSWLYGVQDFCDGYKDSELLMVASNNFTTQSGKIVLLYRAGRGENIQPARYDIRKSSVFSCCCNSFGKNFAIGCEYSITVENSMGILLSRPALGNVHSVHYNDIGSLLYCGIHTGLFSILDLRQRDSSKNIKLFRSGINESTLLSNQQEIILGSFEGELKKFDLRMLRESTKPKNDTTVVAEYVNHVHTTKKSPFSVNETLGLLCATGRDNLTRFWLLKGGIPVKVIRPPVVTDAHKAWLVNDPWKPVVYVFQNKKIYTCKI